MATKGATTITVAATATSTVGISSVQFLLDGSNLGSAVTSSPYQVLWNTASSTDGSHTLTASTTDSFGDSATSSPITVTVENAPPVLSNGAPSGSLPYGTTQVTLSLTTDVSSTCKYGTSPGILYSSLPNLFTTTGGTSQSTQVSGLVSPSADTYYVRCENSLGVDDQSDYLITFSIDGPTISVASGGGGTGYAPPPPSESSSTIQSTSTIPTESTSSPNAELLSLCTTLQGLEAKLSLPQTPVSSCLQGIMTTPTTPASFSFSRNLHLWDQGPDVTALQTFLISEASGPAAAKLQAHGTSQVFGLLTYNALREFQASVGIRATGYFGPLTRAYITAHE